MKFKEYNTIGTLQPLDQSEIKELEKRLGCELPKDYTEFLCTYGYGDFNEMVNIHTPDKDIFRSNYQNHLHLWKLTENEENNIIQGITIADTIDADMVLFLPNHIPSMVIMPRHARQPIFLESFMEVLDYFEKYYELYEDLYFDSAYHFELKVFDCFIQNGVRNKPLFDKIYRQFLSEISFDGVINNPQPKYILQNIGGWVYFDLIHKSSIRIKYQQHFQQDANKVIRFIEEIIQEN